MLDDLESGVHAGGFGEGFHEGIVPLLEVEYFEYLPHLDECISCLGLDVYSDGGRIMLGFRKMFVNAVEFHTSGARFVRWMEGLVVAGNPPAVKGFQGK